MAKPTPPPIFAPSADATLVDQISPAAPDPRAARVHRVHGEIARRVKDGSIYEQPRKSR